MFQGNPAHTGYVKALGPSTSQTKWVYDTNGWVLSSPAIVIDVVYFTYSDAGYFNVSNNNIIAVKAGDGTKTWNYSVSVKIYMSPAVADGRVFFGSDDHTIYALNATTAIGITMLTWRQMVTPALAPLTAVVVTGLLFLFVVLVFTNARAWVTDQTTVNRATLHLAPLVVVFLILGFRAFAARWVATHQASAPQTSGAATLPTT